MSGTPVLGPVAFRAFEVPERVSIGGRQKLVVHALPGGGRVVDAMGPDETPIRWSGTFSGVDAAERVRLLERLRRSGQVLPLSWDGWRYSVIIQEFLAEVTSPWWIPYRIEFCVLPEGGAVAFSDPVLAAGSVFGAGIDALTDQSLATASARLFSSELEDVVAAAGDLAQLVAARASAGIAS